ncbi:hypothetical protein SLEP1_g9149 [Rubroshorea leprosula]|uniref:Receptor-like protein 12 n=1 Tax=Rubroshorea leprosula TaxID=152421 RepID=A0AAV5IDV2_9ROSI|nr:hypothetical protein SLEP1_g9149 [Rubroshorea leprosula]
MGFFTVLSTPLCLLFFFLCLKTTFSSFLHASSFSTTQLCSHQEALALLQFKTSFSINSIASDPEICHVIALDLSCSLLSGIFPSNSTLFFLKNLQSLNLALNDFRLSKIPPEISQFTRLKHLDISSSWFSGQVPAEIAHLPKNLVHNLSEVRELVLNGVNMTSVNPLSFMNLSSSLTTLRLSKNELRGNFPNTIFHFPNLKRFILGGEGNLAIDLPSSNWSSPLQHLDLDVMYCGRRLQESIGDLKSLQFLGLKCNFEGSIPASIGSLSQLTYLGLYSSNLSGQIPSSLANLTQLRSLVLSNNQLSGPIPPFIGNSQLTYLSLPSNNLGEQIPSSLANLTQLIFLNLAENQFSGSIPAFIGSLSQLTSLDLFSNNLSGQIPSSLANLTQLDLLDLSINQLSGPIPAFMGNLSKLILFSNNLSGQIPSSLANLTQLCVLHLSNNQISGPIPAFIGNLSQLTYLSLSSNNLSGQIPSSLANLTQLGLFDLSHNQFSGPIPFHATNHLSDLVVVSDMFSRLQNLKTIILSYNNLSLRNNVDADFTLPELTYLDLSSCSLSEFPNFLRHSNGLRSLLLSKNSINGNIPEWICEKDLMIFDLSHNNLSGKIPNCLPKSLSVLNLQGNNFDGNIPFGFSEGCGLQNLNLHGNQMDGLLPRSLVNCSMLEVLDVGNNNISDTFPHWLESLPELQVLVLRSNKFHGFVHSTKEGPSFPKLRVLDLSSNCFVGALPVHYIENFNVMMEPHIDDGPPEYMTMRNGSYQYSLVVIMKGFEYELQRILTIFTSIDLSNNKFGGEIPDVIGKLSSLKGLNLSHNNFIGPISPSLGNLTNLEWLDLSSNELVGEIPNELVSLTQLSVLNFSNNHLVGRIPQGNQFNTFGNDSYEGNLGLCGIPLSKSCDGNGTQLSSFQEKDELWRFGWKAVVLGYGCGVVFGLLMGYHVFRTGKPKWFVSLFDGRTSQSGRRMRKARRLVPGRS